MELVPFAVEREREKERESLSEEEARCVHNSWCVDDQISCLGEVLDVRQDVAGVECQAVASLRGGYVVGRLRSCLPGLH